MIEEPIPSSINTMKNVNVLNNAFVNTVICKASIFGNENNNKEILSSSNLILNSKPLPAILGLNLFSSFIATTGNGTNKSDGTLLLSNKHY